MTDPFAVTWAWPPRGRFENTWSMSAASAVYRPTGQAPLVAPLAVDPVVAPVPLDDDGGEAVDGEPVLAGPGTALVGSLGLVTSVPPASLPPPQAVNARLRAREPAAR